MVDCFPFKEPGQDPSVHCDAAVTGARLVSIKTGVNEIGGHPRVAMTAAGARWYGVACRDTLAGDEVMVFKQGIVPIQAVGAIAHGQDVEAGANGCVRVLAAGVRVGTCLADAADGALAKIDLDR